MWHEKWLWKNSHITISTLDPTVKNVLKIAWNKWSDTAKKGEMTLS